MKISSSLLKPYLLSLESEFETLLGQINSQSNEEVIDFHSVLSQGKQDLEALKSAVHSLDYDSGSVIPVELYNEFKKIKLQVHFANRKWKRVISKEARIKKIQEKRSHVSTFAA